MTTTTTMTCEQLGGPCDHEHHGATADEVIKAHDQHLEDAIAAGDESHREAAEAMAGRWKRPISGMKWYRQAKKDFAALSADALA